MVEPVDWSQIPPELQAKLKKLDDAPMELQRIQTPDGNVHFIELPAGIDYGQVEISMSEDIGERPIFPPTGSFDEIVSIRKADIPEGADVEAYLYKKRWALFLDVSVEEVGKMMERGHLPPQPSPTERTPVIEFPIEALIGDVGRSNGRVNAARRSEGSPMEASVSVGEGIPVRLIESSAVEPVSQSAASFENQLTPQGIEAQLQERLSPEQFDKAQQSIEQYGTEEGLRRFKEMDPEAARQFEQKHRLPPNHEVPDEVKSSTQ